MNPSKTVKQQLNTFLRRHLCQQTTQCMVIVVTFFDKQSSFIKVAFTQLLLGVDSDGHEGVVANVIVQGQCLLKVDVVVHVGLFGCWFLRG